MKPAEAADELRALTACHIANPRRIVALEMAIKRLLAEASGPVDQCKLALSLLTPADRGTAVEGYCPLCWHLDDGSCGCVKKDAEP